MLVDLSVEAVMTAPVETISPDATLETAATRLAEGVGSLVVTEDGDAVGIVTKTDLVAALAAGRTDATVERAMSTPVHSVHVDDDLGDAAVVLGEADVGQVVVVDDADAVVGVLSATTVVDYVPALAHRHGVAGAGDPKRAGDRDRHGHVREPGRVDTAYEEGDWAFEWDGGDGIAVGNVARFSKHVTEADVEEFAHATGDTNRLHLDDEFAAGTRFGRRIAHGVLSLGLVSAALARMPGAIIYLSQDCSYLGPVDVGERCMATCEVVDDLGDDKYRLDVAVQDEDGEDVLSGGSTILVDDIPE
ncbi:CBS domain-containing protein [Halorubellus sp. JP-L1]|uniref:CBS domain-containing protein n=1 Tax=Halorubellus sp. JP-L1 TaxID=2715753 RepID=UPI00140998EE|nr:CBS domain-containing protein [Halorubellus sp. JP-L1]NHN41757.1 CBS domain-containing protein [Halorubellus sp. JP-L1]